MSQVLLEFKDYVVTDSGVVGVRSPELFERLRRGQPLDGLAALPDVEVETYNRRRDKAHRLCVLTLDDEVTGPPHNAHQWRLPKSYRNFDLFEYLAKCVVERVPVESLETYALRLDEELQMMQERGMEPFLRTLIYMFRKFDENNVVYGVGRGSACASLVLYLLGVHMVDPVLFDIPITEFLR